jgi:hypothetical protein
MLCAIIGYHPTACITQQATKNETSAKTLASLFQMKKNEENMSILGREFVPVGNANKFNMNSHSFPFDGTAMFPSSSILHQFSRIKRAGYEQRFLRD